MQEPLKQWHDTKKIEEDGVFYFVKYFQPKSYEIRNELSWITSTMLRDCSTFTVPEVVDSSINDGYIKMRHVDDIGLSSVEVDVLLNKLIQCAVELHSLIRSKTPRMRTSIVTEKYSEYVNFFTQSRIDIVNQYNKQGLSVDTADWILSQIKRLRTPYFTIVHRDLRCRHLLNTGKGRPVLIDWEFSNISDPAQDLTKIVHDGVVNHGLELESVFDRVVTMYSSEINEPVSELINRVSTFLPIISLEHLKSLILRKPHGYEEEVRKDLLFITAAYNARS